MKKNLLKICALLPLLAILFSSCEKNNAHPVCCVLNTITHPILFEILDKNGNNVVTSPTDILTVTYTKSGLLPINSVLDVFRVQKSATDTSRIATYGGYLLSDADPASTNGSSFMSTNSVDGVTTFTIYRNNQLLGNVFFDFKQTVNSQATSFTSFTLNQNPATTVIITGVLAASFPADLGSIPTQSFQYMATSYFTSVSNIPIYVLHL